MAMGKIENRNNRKEVCGWIIEKIFLTGIVDHEKMIIINNNGATEKQQSQEQNFLVDKIREICLRNFFDGNSRRLYVFLLLTASWCGAAHFYVGRFFLGIITVFLTAMAIPGIVLLVTGWLNSRPLWCWIIPSLSAALIPWIYGIIAGIYWALHTDEEFQNKFFKQKKGD